MGQQRLGFLYVGAMDDAILLRVQTRANRFGEIRMSGQNQKRFHRRCRSEWTKLVLGWRHYRRIMYCFWLQVNSLLAGGVRQNWPKMGNFREDPLHLLR